jgi:2Fe-2S ferredoxin
MSAIRLLPHPELCPQGAVLQAPRGASLCEALLRGGIAIEHACDMVAACATCHVYVQADHAALADPEDDENDQLDHAWGLRVGSRLACCVRLRDTDITVEFPLHGRNHARER